MKEAKISQFRTRVNAITSWLERQSRPLEISHSDHSDFVQRLEATLSHLTRWEPKANLLWFLEECEHLQNLEALENSREIIEPLIRNLRQTLRHGLTLLLEIDPFETPSSRHFSSGDFQFSYASFWLERAEEVNRDPLATLDFSPLYVEKLSQKGWRTLWLQQKKIVQNARSFCGMLADQCCSNILLKSLVQKIQEEGDSDFPGLFNTAFILGRLAHFLDVPPSIQTPGINMGGGIQLEFRGKESRGVIRILDREGHGVDRMESWGTSPQDGEKALQALASALLQEPVVADCKVMGKHSPYWLLLGVRDQQLFQEVHESYLAPWWLDWWFK